jgi:4-amino-4-deoxy-L-arabinose transferase-like glycosyltransferase
VVKLDRQFERPRTQKNKFLTVEFWEKNRYRVWAIGLLARICATFFNLQIIDYRVFRLPIAKRIANGTAPYIPFVKTDSPINNHMPIYPFISALMYLIASPLGNDYVTGMAIKLPLAVGDAFIPFMLYKIGKRLGRSRDGILSSVIYALNPMAMQEISYAHWDGLANLTILIAFYYLLQDKPYLVGLTVGIGFFLKQYPLFILAAVWLYWRVEWLKLAKVAISFLGFGVTLLILVLVPYGISPKLMYDSITFHPIYQGETQHDVGVIKTPGGIAQMLIKVFKFLFDGSYDLWSNIWLVLLAFVILLPLIFYLYSPLEENLVDVITIHSLVLGVFYVAIHDQFLMWSLPWLTFWALRERNHKKFKIVLLAVYVVAYFIRKMKFFYFTDPTTGLIGLWIIVECLISMKQSRLK